MEYFQSIATPVLLDMLAKHTKDFNKMLFSNDRSEVFDECENAVFQLQIELSARTVETGSTVS